MQYDQDKINTILLVEDDQKLAELIAGYLKRYDLDVLIESHGDIAITRILKEQPDLVILDLMLPGCDGFTVCREVRKDFPGPILMLTAKGDDIDQVVGLEIGADDYITKPVDPRVLLARIHANLRRRGRDTMHSQTTTTDETRDTIAYGVFCIDRTTRLLTLDDQEIYLSTNDFELLWFLASQAGNIVSRDEIFKHLRGIPYDGIDRSIDMCVSRLRKKLGDDSLKPTRIKTIWGKGYLFVKKAWKPLS